MSDPSDIGPRATVEPPLQRTITPVSGRLGAPRPGGLVLLAGLAAGCSLLLLATWRGHPSAKDQSANLPARQVVAFEPARAPTLQDPGPNAPDLTKPGLTPQVPALQPDETSSQQAGASSPPAPAAPLIAYRQAGARAPAEGQVARPSSTASAAATAGTVLDRLRQTSAVTLAKATQLPNRDFLIVAGTSLPCVLQTAMSSATPGYVSCVIPRDVLSDSGGVVLLEKGARVLGEYRADLRQGQNRLFVLWTRAVTPTGVAIALASPAADPLGRAGFDGQRDTHFWARFGGALLLSLVDDSVSAATTRNSTSNAQQTASDAASVALQASVTIPPTLTKPQGSEVSIFVAQDLDFSTVYALEAR